MANDRIDAYADALFGVAAAEGRLDDVEDELFRFARVFEGSDELRAALTDPQTVATRRQQIVEDLLAGQGLADHRRVDLDGGGHGSCS